MEEKIKDFRKIVWAHYRAHGRHDLPWRKTKDPYRVLVSEIMLQQTQVERVIPFYKNFIKQFPTAKKLAASPLAEVLKVWQGLGYNRRAKMLREAARELGRVKSDFKNSKKSDFTLRSVQELEKLPGVGKYTARAVAAFAFDEDAIVVETNIRTAVTHHFFAAHVANVSDADIEKILERALPKGRAREWYSALMDYGAYLKRGGISHNARSKGYTKQSKFSGSSREARGAILRALASGSRTSATLINLLGLSRRSQLATALVALEREGLIKKAGQRYSLAE